jgi:hypothetical protein
MCWAESDARISSSRRALVIKEPVGCDHHDRPDFASTAVMARLNFALESGSASLSLGRSCIQQFESGGLWPRSRDFNYSGVVEIGDFAILAGMFNSSLPAAGALPRAAAIRPLWTNPPRFAASLLDSDDPVDSLASRPC